MNDASDTGQTGADQIATDAIGLQPCDVRQNIHIPGNRVTAYLTEKTGDVTYRFNSKGYRGEELDPDARFRICVIGESHAMGLGVALRDTFGQRLKHHVAKALGMAPRKVNCVNLSVSGISSDYCVRTVFRQLNHLPVDMVVCCLPAPNRMEYCRPNGYAALNLTGLTPETLETAPVPLLAFADFYTDRMGHIALMKNALLLQDFFKRRGIGYVLSSQHLTKARRRADYLQAFDADLDEQAFLEDRFFELRPDRAADGRHGGPRTHSAFAIAVMERFANAQIGSKRSARAAKLLAYAKEQKQTNPDWAFFQSALNKDAAPTSEPDHSAGGDSTAPMS